jgi:hypothetical protein
MGQAPRWCAATALARICHGTPSYPSVMQKAHLAPRSLMSGMRLSATGSLGTCRPGAGHRRQRGAEAAHGGPRSRTRVPTVAQGPAQGCRHPWQPLTLHHGPVPQKSLAACNCMVEVHCWSLLHSSVVRLGLCKVRLLVDSVGISCCQQGVCMCMQMWVVRLKNVCECIWMWAPVVA